MAPNKALPWRPSNFIKFSIFLHAVLLVALVCYWRAWPWILAIFIANQLLLSLIGLWPRSNWVGSNLTRLPPNSSARGEIALTIDDGPDPEVTPLVLDILDRYGVKANFFCVGATAARYPILCKRIIQHGHAIENHTQHHPHYFAFLSPARLKREIQSAQETISEITGRTPLFFRAPTGLRSPLLDPVLARLGLRLASWTRRGFDTRTANPAVVSRRLLKHLKPGAILMLHDGNSARSSCGVPVIVAVLPILLEAATTAGLHFVTLSQVLQHENKDS